MDPFCRLVIKGARCDSGSRTAKNIRPTINSYMFVNAQAIAQIARMANEPKLAIEFDTKAVTLKRLTQEQLWDSEVSFFKVHLEVGQLSDALEAIGFIPWMFNLPNDWETAHGMDPNTSMTRALI